MKVRCFTCKRIVTVNERKIRGTNETYFEAEAGPVWFIGCEMTGYKASFFCDDCRGFIVMFSEIKERFAKQMEKAATEKTLKVYERMHLELTFEIFGELSSIAVNTKRLADSYTKMADLAESKAKGVKNNG